MGDNTQESGNTEMAPSVPNEQLDDQQKLAVMKNRTNVFTASAGHPSISKLDGNKNWELWYGTILGMCEMSGIDGILTGDDLLPTPREKESDTAFNNRSVYWKTANKYIMGIIRCSVNTSAMAHVIGLTSAYQMILALQGAYKPKGYTTREVLWRVLTRTASSDYKNVTEWVEVMKKSAKSLKDLTPAAQALPPWVYTTTLLHGLPSPSYDAFVEIILNSCGRDAAGNVLEPDFDNVVEKVLDRERRQKLDDTSNNKALKASGNNNNNSNSNANANSNSNSGSRSNGNRGNGRDRRKKCEECGVSHGPVCYLAHPEQAPQEWRDSHKEKIAEFQKKKKEAKDEKEKKEKACCAMNMSTKDTGFFFDTAASLHYTYSKAWYESEPTQLDDPIEVEGCDGGTVYATHIGRIRLDILVTSAAGEDEECGLTIRNVYYCPEMNTNLLSLGTLVRNGLSFGATNSRLKVTDSDGDTVMEGALVNTLFKLRLSESDDSKAREVAKAMTAKGSPNKKASAKYWHETMGHLNYPDLARLPTMVQGMQIIGPIKKEFCEPCALAKQHREPSRAPMSAVDGPFHRIHTDLLGGGDTLPLTIGGHKYASTITEQATRHRWVEFLKKKDQALAHLKNYVKYVQIQFNTTPRIIRSDNGGEYDSEEARDWMKSEGIIQELTMPDCPEQNGIDERTNGILITRARTQLIACGLPNTLWAEAFRTAIYIINRSPTAALDKTPYEALYGAKPNLSRMHPFGLVCYAHDYKCKTRGKMAPRGFKCYFLGYEGTNQYRLWDGHRAQLVRRRDVIWGPFESSNPSSNTPGGQPGDLSNTIWKLESPYWKE